jgi:hypothetical protein
MNAQGLVPLLAGEIERVEITLTDEEMVSMDRSALSSYEALLEAAVGYGLEVITERDSLRMCTRAFIRRQGNKMSNK